MTAPEPGTLRASIMPDDAVAAASAPIKAIEASTIHQIQSGQVIVDLRSVAKELVENGLDAGATSIDVRFKNQGLDSIEVQDNGSGISPQNYEGLALKHHTSKLSTYADLDTLETFGFRGEALSSLCALSHFTVVTCMASDVPRGARLDFETSGKLRGTAVVASQKGTTVTVENLFQNLPVRRRELERNIKREWAKVVGLLNQYACVRTAVKFTVSQQPTKGKRIVLFSTKGNRTTRENIINVFGAKTMVALVPLALTLELETSAGLNNNHHCRPLAAQEDRRGGRNNTTEIRVLGHVSRPAHGEGRQTPDRQMFYVNGRPCQLPQFAKVFNDVYRSYNTTQSPFIFADIQLDTHLYDVNVSPDKRTILLHDQGRMLDTLRESLIELFEKQDITVPLAQLSAKTLPFKKLTTFQSAQSSSSTASKSRTAVSPGEKAEAAMSYPPADHSADEADLELQSAGEASQQPPPLKYFVSSFLSSSSLPREHHNEPISSVKSSAHEPDDAASSSPDPDTTTSRTEEFRPDEQSPKPTRETRELSKADVEEEQDADEEEAADEGEAEGEVERDEEGEERDEEGEERDEEGGEEEGDDLGDSADDNNEPPIPAVVTPSRKQHAARIIAVPSARMPKRQSRETATITIGSQTITGTIGSSPKRPKQAKTAAPRTRKSHATPLATALPSFGGRLTQIFAAHRRGHVHADEEVERATDEEEEDASTPAPEDPDEDGGSEDLPEAESDTDQIAGAASSEEEPEAATAAPLQGLSPNAADDPDTEIPDADADEDFAPEEEEEAREETAVREKVYTIPPPPGEYPTEEFERRRRNFLKGGRPTKDSTFQYMQRLKTDEKSMRSYCEAWAKSLKASGSSKSGGAEAATQNGLEAEDAEEKLSLIISKSDFAKMKVVGQFNLGFILAVRGTSEAAADDDDKEEEFGGSRARNDELFIIDQHASDEKFNFERLQASTVVQSQRLVRPKPLELTAVEEEIVMENQKALEANGFSVGVDTSGDAPVGSRCQLLSLPLSRETTFTLADLEELISLLSEGSGATSVPRPSRVRRMFAMRACRSSIMIGRALSLRQMEKVVRHMGEMEKPWNCPHGRPTMRHLCSLSLWDRQGEGRGWTDDGYDLDRPAATVADWTRFLDEA